MSREQRRNDRQEKAGADRAAPPNRRTPVKAPGSGGVPWVPIVVAGGTMLVVLLLVYLIFQSRGEDANVDENVAEAADSDPGKPGEWFQDQGRSHFSYGYDSARAPVPFCEGVPRSKEAQESDDAYEGADEGDGTPTARATSAATVSATSGTATTGTAASSSTTPAATPTAQQGCYSSNPPTSGDHLGVLRDVDLGNGVTIAQLPPPPNVYAPDIEIPREAIAHILEHAHFFVGYNCAEGDDACQEVVNELEDLVNDRIDNNDNRIVMANDSDLPEGTVAVASWTRVLRVPFADFDRGDFEEFFSVHNCRIDWENFCR